MVVPDVRKLNWFEVISTEGTINPYSYVYGRLEKVTDAGVAVEFICGEGGNINYSGIFIPIGAIEDYRVLIPKIK